MQRRSHVLLEESDIIVITCIKLVSGNAQVVMDKYPACIFLECSFTWSLHIEQISGQEKSSQNTRKQMAPKPNSPPYMEDKKLNCPVY